MASMFDDDDDDNNSMIVYDDDYDDNMVMGVCRGHGSIVKWLKLDTLGKGASAIVHKVKLTNSEPGEVFAVKSCVGALSSMLCKELEILRHFQNCRNVVQCYEDVISIERGLGLVYHLFLEFAPGGTLSDLIRNKYGGNIPESHVKYYTTMLLLGICDIHERGYVHCDLKPANILVYPSQYSINSICGLKIADFGLARRIGEKVDNSRVKHPTFVGTPVYMPYEGMNAESVSPSLDIWSLGCVVVEMITGNRPWKYRTMADLVRLLTTSTPEIPHHMSSLGKDFLMKCLARNPSERWTAHMLLSHPFLIPDLDPKPSPPPTKSTIIRPSQSYRHTMLRV